MTDLTKIDSDKNKKEVEARVSDDGRVLITFDEGRFGEFISDVLSEKQLLERTYQGALVVHREDLLEFHHLISHKVKNQSQILLETVSMRIFYETGESHTVHGFENIESYSDPRNVLPTRVNFEWQFIRNSEKSSRAVKTDIAITFQLFDKPKYGEVSVAINHNDRLFANEIVQLIEPPINRVIEKDDIFSITLKAIKEFSGIVGKFFIYASMIFGITLGITDGFVPGITRVDDGSQAIIDDSNDLLIERETLFEQYDKIVLPEIDAMRGILQSVDTPGRGFRNEIIKSANIVGTESAFTYLLLSPHFDGLYTNYLSYDLDRHKELGGEHPDPYVKAERGSYIMPGWLHWVLYYDEPEYLPTDILLRRKKDNLEVFESLDKLIYGGHLDTNLTEVLGRYTRPLREKFKEIDAHLENISNAAEDFRPKMQSNYEKIVEIRPLLSQSVGITPTRFARTLIVICLFLIPLYFLLEKINTRRSFIVLNNYAKNMAKGFANSQKILKTGFYFTVVLSILCSITANGLYDLFALGLY